MNQAVLSRNFRKVGFVVASVVIATLLYVPPRAQNDTQSRLAICCCRNSGSRYEGVIPGICAALLSVVAFDWFFDHTPQLLDFTVGNGLRIIVFVSLSVMIAFLDQQRRHTLQKLAENNQVLQKALDEIETLRGILPICACCKKIETDPQTWVEVDNYVANTVKRSSAMVYVPTAFESFPRCSETTVSSNKQDHQYSMVLVGRCIPTPRGSCRTISSVGGLMDDRTGWLLFLRCSDSRPAPPCSRPYSCDTCS